MTLDFYPSSIQFRKMPDLLRASLLLLCCLSHTPVPSKPAQFNLFLLSPTHPHIQPRLPSIFQECPSIFTPCSIQFRRTPALLQASSTAQTAVDQSHTHTSPVHAASPHAAAHLRSYALLVLVFCCILHAAWQLAGTVIS